MGCTFSEENKHGGEVDEFEQHQRQQEPQQHKVIVIGDSSVGKSSLVTSVMSRPFSPEHRSTIGTAYAAVEISPRAGMPPIELQLWDTAGEERFKSMTSFFYRKTQVAILVFDVQSRNSLQSLYTWHEDIVRVSPNVRFIVAGNKMDCPEEYRKVEESEAQAVAQEFNAPLFWASAKSGEGVKELFQHAALLTL